MIETGESETIFQKAILDQGRGRVLDTLAEIQVGSSVGCWRWLRMALRQCSRLSVCRVIQVHRFQGGYSGCNVASQMHTSVQKEHDLLGCHHKDLYKACDLDWGTA